jgi:threonyl-tRNA synthetase
LEAELRGLMVRAEVDDSKETFNKKVRNNTVRRLPILLIVGEREQAESTVTVRRYKVQEQRSMPFTEFLDLVQAEIRSRTHVKAW